MTDNEIDLSPKIIDLVLYAGDGATFRLTILDKEGKAVPLIGTMDADIRVKRTDPDPPSTYFAIDLSNANDGIALLSLTGEQTQGLVSEKKFQGVWDLQWTPTDKQPRTLCQGKVVCHNDVSR